MRSRLISRSHVSSRDNVHGAHNSTGVDRRLHAGKSDGGFTSG